MFYFILIAFDILKLFIACFSKQKAPSNTNNQCLCHQTKIALYKDSSWGKPQLCPIADKMGCAPEKILWGPTPSLVWTLVYVCVCVLEHIFKEEHWTYPKQFMYDLSHTATSRGVRLSSEFFMATIIRVHIASCASWVFNCLVLAIHWRQLREGLLLWELSCISNYKCRKSHLEFFIAAINFTIVQKFRQNKFNSEAQIPVTHFQEVQCKVEAICQQKSH